MEVLHRNNDIIIRNLPDFEPRHIFECGQCFRWDKIDDCTYSGTAYSRGLTISRRENDIILYDTTLDDFENIWRGYFDLDTDYSLIKSALSDGGVMSEAISAGSGIRILRQDAWEAIISFIISASNNIPRIKGIISRLCESFGDPVLYRGEIRYSFPAAERLAGLSLEDLSVIRAGFRDKYILAAAKAVSDGSLNLNVLASMSDADARSALMKLRGVGEKVADCVMLFGLHRCSAFPIDVWVKRITELCFFGGADTNRSVIADFARDRFGELGGFAQQYLFYWARENKIGT